LGEICIEKAVELNQVGVGEPLTFIITLTEPGLRPNFVDVTDVLPPGVEFQSVAMIPPGVGSCTETAPNTVSCDGLAVDPFLFDPTTVTIEAIPTQCGTFTNIATGRPATGGGVIEDSADFTVVGCEEEAGGVGGAGGGGGAAPITQEGEQGSEVGEIDQPFDVS
jgi:uncharacterized repeat protein (TIGR01451 family)